MILASLIPSEINLTWFFCTITGSLISFFLYRFIGTSVREKKYRAALITVPVLLTVISIWIDPFHIFNFSETLRLTLSVIFWLFAALFFLPIWGGQSAPIKIKPTTQQVDERDTMFARSGYKPGTEKYESYYASRPEYKEIDDKIRKLPELLDPGGKYHDEKRSKAVDDIFDEIHGWVEDVDGPVNPEKTDCSAREFTDRVKKITLELTADEVGIAELNQSWLYSHVGRGPQRWGEPISNQHKYVIPFTVEMDYFKVEQAPDLPITEETAQKYHQAAKISIAVAKFIRDLGYSARAHISGSNYQLMLPPAAHAAGLGELGRHGYLISAKFGSRVRLGAVTTDLPLVTDKPVNLGVQDFCAKCLRCVNNCPSHSIPAGDKEVVRGVEKWPLNIESCFIYWRGIGTDCGLCMKVCPYSHPKNLLHNLVRAGIKRSAFARYLSVLGEDLFYGKKVRF